MHNYSKWPYYNGSGALEFFVAFRAFDLPVTFIFPIVVAIGAKVNSSRYVGDSQYDKYDGGEYANYGIHIQTN
jgi:hypothetical protein